MMGDRYRRVQDFFTEAIDIPPDKVEELGKLARSVCDPFAGGVVQLADNGTSIVPIITISCADVPKSVRRGPPIQNIPGYVLHYGAYMGPGRCL